MNDLHVKYLLIGGGVASFEAARAIREFDPDAQLMLVGAEVNRPYHRPPLSKDYLLGQSRRDNLFTAGPEWFAVRKIELRTGKRASHLDPTRHIVTLDDGAEIAYDKLLLATGATPIRLNIPGADLPNVHYLRTIEDADRIRHAVEKARFEGRPHEKRPGQSSPPLGQPGSGPMGASRGQGRAVVIGAGLLGVELAAALSEMGMRVDLVVSSFYPWNKYAGDTAGRFLSGLLETNGVHLHSRTSAIRLEGDGRVQRVVLADGSTLETDFVVAAVGVASNRELLRGTSIKSEKSILVDQYCQTNVPDVYAAGDCAAIFDPLFAKYRRIDHWDGARQIGILAGRNMTGKNEALSGVTRFTSRIFGIDVHVWGEPRLVERRIIRGAPTLEKPQFAEIGIAADGRIAQIFSAGMDPGEELSQLVAARLNVTGHEEALKDPHVRLPKP